MVREQAYESVRDYNERMRLDHRVGMHQRLMFGCPQCADLAKSPQDRQITGEQMIRLEQIYRDMALLQKELDGLLTALGK